MYVRAGIERLADYQDVDYARDYLATLKPIAGSTQRHGGGSGSSSPRPRASLRSAWPTRIRSASPS